MKVKINDKFYINVDDCGNHTLTEHICFEDKINKKTNEIETVERTKLHGHFNSVKQAVIKYIKLKLYRQNEEIELKTYLDEFNKNLSYFSKIYENEE